MEANKTARPAADFGTYTPELRDYTLKEEFRDPFKVMPQVTMHGWNLALDAFCLLLIRLINNKQPMNMVPYFILFPFTWWQHRFDFTQLTHRHTHTQGDTD